MGGILVPGSTTALFTAKPGDNIFWACGSAVMVSLLSLLGWTHLSNGVRYGYVLLGTDCGDHGFKVV